MKEYQCHKKVFAAQIASCDLVDNTVTYQAEDGSRQLYQVDRAFFSRGVPPAGSYLVEYNGGEYASWSPKHVFEDGYRETGSTTTSVSFGDALIALEAGLRVAREGWNGKGMWLELANHGTAFSDSCRLDPYDLDRFITMKTADGKYIPWLASQTDMLAKDWVVFNKPY